MVALRHAAALVHALPGVHLRIRSEERALLSVGPPWLVGGPAMGPCAFRMAVAKGHEQIKRGDPVTFMGLADGAPLHIDVGVVPGGSALAGGIYRVPCGQVALHATTTTLPLRRCRELLAERTLPAGVDPDAAVGLRHDAATEITVLHTAGEPGPVADAQLRLLQHALEAVAADELVRALAVG